MVRELGSLRQVDFTEVWNTEPEFSSWLSKEENMSLLTKDLKISDIYDVVCEDGVGKFRADIYGKISDDLRVIIENKRNESDHDHIGKLITYAAGKDASVMILIVEKALPEHRAAIAWLNENMSDKSFYLVELKILKINNSLPAIHFDCVEGPNEFIQVQKNSGNDYNQERYDFWDNLIKYLNGSGKIKDFHKKFRNIENINPNGDRWLLFSVGTSKLHFYIYLHSNSGKLTSVDCNIKIREDTDYQLLLSNQENIESQFTEDMEWFSNEDKKWKRICIIGPSITDNNNEDVNLWIRDILIKSYDVVSGIIALK